MAYPNRVNVNVDGFGVADGQNMDFISGSVPPSYQKDFTDPTSYDICVLRRNAAGTNWELFVRKGVDMFIGERDPDKDDPLGSFKDAGTQTAEVKEIL